VHNLEQAANWRSLVKTSLEQQSCPLSQINRLDQNPLGLLPLAKSINLKEGTRLQLQRCFYQTALICSMRQIVHIYPISIQTGRTKAWLWEYMYTYYVRYKRYLKQNTPVIRNSHKNNSFVVYNIFFCPLQNESLLSKLGYI
jgi:hypothetical protein